MGGDDTHGLRSWALARPADQRVEQGPALRQVWERVLDAVGQRQHEDVADPVAEPQAGVPDARRHELGERQRRADRPRRRRRGRAPPWFRSERSVQSRCLLWWRRVRLHPPDVCSEEKVTMDSNALTACFTASPTTSSRWPAGCWGRRPRRTTRCRRRGCGCPAADHAAVGQPGRLADHGGRRGSASTCCGPAGHAAEAPLDDLGTDPDDGVPTAAEPPARTRRTTAVLADAGRAWRCSSCSTHLDAVRAGGVRAARPVRRPVRRDRPGGGAVAGGRPKKLASRARRRVRGAAGSAAAADVGTQAPGRRGLPCRGPGAATSAACWR